MHRYLRVEYTQYTMKVQTNDSPQVFNLFVLFFVFRSTFLQVKCYFQYLFCQASQGSKKGMLRLQGAQFGRCVSITLMHQSLSKVSRTQRTETCFATSKRRRLSKLAELVRDGAEDGILALVVVVVGV